MVEFFADCRPLLHAGGSMDKLMRQTRNEMKRYSFFLFGRDSDG